MKNIKEESCKRVLIEIIIKHIKYSTAEYYRKKFEYK